MLSFLKEMFTHIFEVQLKWFFWSSQHKELSKNTSGFDAWTFGGSNLKVDWEKSVWTKFRFFASGFCSHVAFWHWVLLFSNFMIWLFVKWFHPDPFRVLSLSCFLFGQWKFFELRQASQWLLFRGSSFFLLICFTLILFLVIHKPQFSRLTSELPHSLFQLNGFSIHSRIELRNVLNNVKDKRAKLKETVKTDKVGSLCHWAFSYHLTFGYA